MAFYTTLSALIYASIWVLEPVAAGSIATWITGQGAPQVIMQDDATGKIFYSLCNSNGSTPIFPANESAALTFEDDFTPKNGTSLTGIGYPAADGANTVSVNPYRLEQYT